jgi:hypothetical protein
MAEEVKDIRVDSDHGLDVNELTKATQELKAQLQAKEKETSELRAYAQQAARVAQDRDAAAKKAEAELNWASSRISRADHLTVATALQSHEKEAEALQSQYAAAIETADGKTAAKIQLQIAELAARKLQLQQGKERIEEEITAAERAAKQPRPQQQTQQRQAPSSTDPYEDGIATLPENQKQWLRQHKDKGYFTPGQGIHPKVLSAYYAAQADGLDERSPQFTAHMDRALGHGGEPEHGDAAERFIEVEQPKPQPQRQPAQQQQRRAVPAAPVSRDAGGGGGRSQSIRLTAAQAQAAERMQMTPQEYVEGMREAIKVGKWPAGVPLPTWA